MYGFPQQEGHMPRGHHVCCIVPPYILDRLAESDDAALRERARQTLVWSERLRGRRAAFAGGPAGTTPTGMKQRTVYDARHGTNLPGTLVRSEDGPPSPDPVVEEAFKGAGDTYDFYKT